MRSMKYIFHQLKVKELGCIFQKESFVMKSLWESSDDTEDVNDYLKKMKMIIMLIIIIATVDVLHKG